VAGQLATIDPDAVRLKALNRASPSIGAALLSCELSVAFRLDDRFAFLNRPTPASALGTIAHELAEEVANGRFDSVGTEDVALTLNRAWGAKLAFAEEELARAHPEGAVPAPRRWTGYEQTRVRILDLLAAELHSRLSRRAGGVGSLQLEVPLQPDGVPLQGRADRVETSADGVELVDLKTGWTLPEELKPAHRQQLLAYAYLWHATHGVWPRRASIQRLDGTRLTFDVDPTEAEGAAAELIGALEKFNRDVEGGASRALASPSPESCRYCPYRPACRPFFESVNEEWGWYRKSCLGIVTEIVGGRDAMRLELDLQGGNTSTSVANLVNVPRQLAPATGTVVAVVDAVPTRVEGDLRLVWDSTICTWSSAESLGPRTRVASSG
jgi:RecB family exonuclease